MTSQFSSIEMEQLAGITARQLQWWDEKNVVQPDRVGGGRRVYTAEQAFLVLVVAELRHKGLTLQKVRKILRTLQKKLTGSNPLEYLAETKLVLVTDGKDVSITEENLLVPFLSKVRRAVHVVSLCDSARRVRRPFYELSKRKAS